MHGYLLANPLYPYDIQPYIDPLKIEETKWCVIKDGDRITPPMSYSQCEDHISQLVVEKCA